MRRITHISSWAYVNAEHQSFVGAHIVFDDGSLWEVTNGDWAEILEPQSPPSKPVYDPIEALEAKGGRLTGDDGYIVWGVPTGPVTFEEGDGMFGAVTITEIREAATKLLARLEAKNG